MLHKALLLSGASALTALFVVSADAQERVVNVFNW
jgi:hypothetical protein